MFGVDVLRRVHHDRDTDAGADQGQQVVGVGRFLGDQRREPGLEARLHRRVPHGGAARGREGDEPLTGEVGQRHAVGLGQGMGVGQRHHQALDPDHARGHALAGGQRDEPEVERAVDDPGERFARVGLAAQRELDPRQLGGDRAGEAREHVVAARTGEPDRDAADLPEARGPHRVPGHSRLGQHPASGLQQRLAGSREPDSPGVALEERHPEIAFEQPDLPAQRRLRHVQPRGRAAEVQFFRDSNETPR
ncbi:hypothetical protein GCM10009533_54070 [Saccharopolyspora spinosporotrichia]|uniref:Uncharacterized protein n=1 Tax=Saccharopolyspora erythraea TaxID=1836 RepID=A0ABP3NRJ2_SACER